MSDTSDNDPSGLLAQYGEAEIFPVVTRMPADLITPFGAYLRLSAGTVHSFLFESVEGGENLARYSFLGAGPVSIVSGGDGADLFGHLKRELRPRTVARVRDLPSFIGGAVGYFDFSMVGEFEPVLRGNGPAPGFGSKFAFYRTVVCFDHARQQVSVISLVFADDCDGRGELEESIKAAARKNLEICRVLLSGELPKISSAAAGAAAEIESNWTKEDFERAVGRIKEMIEAGECYQVVLSQCFTKRTPAQAEEIYRALRSLNPSPYMILLRHGDGAIVGASPEMLVRCREGRLEYRPIAGTRPRGRDEAEDERLAREMQADIKEVSEHTMLVDLGRNDLGRVSKYGSVRIGNLMNVEKFSHVQHLVTYLHAELSEDRDRFDALASCFPAGTVTGAPKVRAIQIIEELEPTPRGVYSGAVGYIDYAGNLDTCIAIRTLELKNDGTARVQAGAGIVADSVPEKEYEETVHKARGLFRAIELAEKGLYRIDP